MHGFHSLALLLALAADPPKGESTVNLVPVVSGYVHAQLSVGLDGTGDGLASTATLFLRRARVRVRGQVLQGVGYTLMADLATSNNLMRDAYVSITLIPHHELRIGQQKTQFGYENPESTPNLFAINRAYVSDVLGRGLDLRDLGIGVLGTWKLPAGFGVDYQLTGVNGAGPNMVVDDTPRKNVWGRAGASYGGSGWTVKAGFSGAVGDRLFRADPATGAPALKVAFTRVGMDVRADTPWAFAVAEGVLGTHEPAPADIGATSAGFYVLVAGKTPWNAGPIARAEVFDPGLETAGDRLRRYTLGAYGDLKPVNARLLISLELDASERRRDHALLSWVQVVF